MSIYTWTIGILAGLILLTLLLIHLLLHPRSTPPHSKSSPPSSDSSLSKSTISETALNTLSNGKTTSVSKSRERVLSNGGAGGGKRRGLRYRDNWTDDEESDEGDDSARITSSPAGTTRAQGNTLFPEFRAHSLNPSPNSPFPSSNATSRSSLSNTLQQYTSRPSPTSIRPCLKKRLVGTPTYSDASSNNTGSGTGTEEESSPSRGKAKVVRLVEPRERSRSTSRIGREKVRDEEGDWSRDGEGDGDGDLLKPGISDPKDSDAAVETSNKFSSTSSPSPPTSSHLTISSASPTFSPIAPNPTRLRSTSSPSSNSLLSPNLQTRRQTSPHNSPFVVGSQRSHSPLITRAQSPLGIMTTSLYRGSSPSTQSSSNSPSNSTSNHNLSLERNGRTSSPLGSPGSVGSGVGIGMGKRRRAGSNASINSATGTTTVPASNSQTSSETTSIAKREIVQPKWIREKKGFKGEREERIEKVVDEAVSNGNGTKDVATSSSLSKPTSTTSNLSNPTSQSTTHLSFEKNDRTRSIDSENPAESDFEDCSEGDLSNPSTPTDLIFPLTSHSSIASNGETSKHNLESGDKEATISMRRNAGDDHHHHHHRSNSEIPSTLPPASSFSTIPTQTSSPIHTSSIATMIEPNPASNSGDPSSLSAPTNSSKVKSPSPLAPDPVRTTDMFSTQISLST